MCLLSIFTAPTTDDETRLAVLGAAMASQVVNMREHMDSLYLKKMVRKDPNVIKKKSTIGQSAKSQNAERKLDNKEASQNHTVPKNFAGVEGRDVAKGAIARDPAFFGNQKDCWN